MGVGGSVGICWFSLFFLLGGVFGFFGWALVGVWFVEVIIRDYSFGG